MFGCLKGQDQSIQSSEHSIKILAQQITGPDDLLVNGIQYIPEHKYASGSPEFEYPNAQKSVLYIKGQKFENIPLALDIVSDHVLLIRDFGNGLETKIILHPAYVDSFTIGGNLFINAALINSSSKGYFEKISNGDVKFLRKYKKSYLRIYDNSNRGKYSPQRSGDYLADSQGNLISVNNKGAFLKYFASEKIRIRNYLKQEKIRYNDAGKNEIQSLMNFCNTLTDEIL